MSSVTITEKNPPKLHLAVNLLLLLLLLFLLKKKGTFFRAEKSQKESFGIFFFFLQLSNILCHTTAVINH